LWTAALLDDIIPVRTEGIEMIDTLWPSPCGRSQAPSMYHRAIVSSEGIGAIKKDAKAHRGTINDVLMAAYFLSMSDLTGHMGPQKLFFPVDLRRYLKDGSRVMSNQSANIGFPMMREPGEGMPQILDKVIRETTRLKDHHISIRDHVAFDRSSDPEGKAVNDMVLEMARSYDDGLADIFISNPGLFTLPQLKELIDAYVCYPGVYMPSTCFVVSTFRDTMTITMGYQDDEGPREATRRALQGFVDYLPIVRSQVRFL
jgi:NRPS condensation-like uncharacterized protein